MTLEDLNVQNAMQNRLLSLNLDLNVKAS